MAASRSTARTKKASSAKAPTKSARAAKTAKPASTRAKTTARAKTAPAKRTARTPAAKPAAKAPALRTSPAKVAARSAGTIDRLQQVALTATNLDASVDFYRDVLGLRFITRFDPPGLAFFSLGGGIRLLLSATASQASLYFQVDNVDDAVRTLRNRGVRFLQQQPQMIQRDEAGDFGKKGMEEWMAFFNDPAGNLLALVERR